MRVSSMRRTGVSSGFWKPASTTSPMNRVWSPRSTVLCDPAVEPGHGLVEDGRAGGAVVEGEAVEGAGREVDLDRLGELADDGPVLPVDDVQAEHPALGDQLVGERLLLHRDRHQLGVGADLGDPVGVMPLRRSPARLPMTYRPEGMVHITRRRSLSYSSGSRPSGTGPTIPSCTGMERDATAAGATPRWRGPGRGPWPSPRPRCGC